MELLQEIKSIVDTLPIGYYFGSGLPVKVDAAAETSYIDLKNLEIVISTQNIKNVDEKNIRPVLYHELSHAILTPEKLFEIYMIPETKNIMNIFEDERIETILKNYYIDCNFSKNIYTINGITKADELNPKNEIEYFYKIVRFRVSKKWNIEIDKIIKKYKKMDRNADISVVCSYKQDVMDLYYKIAEEFIKIQEQQEKQQEQEQGQEKGQEQQQEKQQEQQEQQEEAEKSKKQSKDATEKSEIEQKEAKESEEKQEAQQQEEEQQFKELKQALKNEIEKAKMENSSNYKEQFKKLFDSKNKLGNQEGGLKLNYGSNKINLKNYCKDNKNNYRFFEKSKHSDLGNQKKKIVLNLFIDASGSYISNVYETNKIINALREIESQNLKVNVYRMHTDSRIEQVNGSFETHCDSNLAGDHFWISNSINKINQLTQPSDYNVILFDGSVDYVKLGRRKYVNSCINLRGLEPINKEAFKYLNRSNNIIISDFENQDNLNKYCKNCLKVFTSDYTNELFKNIYTLLNNLL